MSTFPKAVESLSYAIQEYNPENSTTLTRIIDQLENISRHSTEADTIAINVLALFLQENLLSIYNSNQVLSKQELTLLKQWPKLLEDYVNKVSPSVTTRSLINNLSSDIWPNKMPKEDTQILMDMLLPEGSEASSEPENNDPMSETLTILKDTLSKVIGGDKESLNNVYKQISTLTESTQSSDNIGFHDLCLLIQDNISQLIESDSIPSDIQMVLLSSWCNLAVKYLNNQNEQEHAIDLIRNLENEHWPTPLSEQDALILSDILGIRQNDAEENLSTENAFSFPQYLTKITNLILSIKESDERLTEINTTIENLIEMSANENYLGLQDICLIYQEGFNELVQEPIKLDDSDIEFLASWPKLVNDYYQNTNGVQSINNLLLYLQDNRWQTPIAVVDSELLNSILKEDQQIAHESSVHFQAKEPQETEDTSSILELHATPQSVAQELVDMLLSEMHSIMNEMDQIIPGKDEEQDKSLEKLAQYSLRMERFGNACQAAELSGLNQSCVLLNKNLNYFLTNATAFTENHTSLLQKWPDKVAEYLKLLGGHKASLALVDFLSEANWPIPILDDIKPALSDLLEAAYISNLGQQISDRQTEATSDDVSIELTEDINPDLLEGLLQELPGQTADFSSYIQNLFEGEIDISLLDKAQRIAHTIKGAANTVGIRGVAILTHQIEDILQILTDNQKIPPKSLTNSLLSAADCLEEMCDCLMERRPGPQYAQSVLQNLLDWANRLEKDGIEILDEEIDSGATSIAFAENHDESKITNVDEQVEKEPVEQDKSQAPTIRIATEVIDNLLRMVGEIMILNLQLQEKIKSSSIQTNNFKEHSDYLKNLTGELERYIEISGSAFSSKQAVNQNTVFDPLELEEYNELHTTSHRIVESATDAHEINKDIENGLKEVNELLIEQSRLQQQIQDSVMQTRMVPVATIIPRLERSVRQTCRSTQKQARLFSVGSDTLIDSNILNNMIDPLMHMIRNSIDHGIEETDTRLENGKDKVGRIELSFAREGTQIIIRFSDDGKGLDKERIRGTAIKKGLLKNEDKPDDTDLYRLILQPGFTTRQDTTLTSGRGIGMDVVYTQLLALNGTLEINSEIGSGVSFELKLPASLMTSHAIFIRHHEQLLAISNKSVVQILHPNDGELIDKNNKLHFKLHDELLPVESIDNLLNVKSKMDIEINNDQPSLLVRQENINHVVFIEKLVDSRNIVIKQTGNYIQKVRGVLGATISGDGSVVPVIDLPELIRTSDLSITSDQTNFTHTNVIKLLPTVLIVDDSISARRALSQIAKDAGYDIQTAKDGLEAIGLIEKKLPSIALVDFEMPRMNGIELTSHIRATESMKHLPIIMITSRTTDKHRELAFSTGVNEYLSKPFSEDNLLDLVQNLILQ